MSISAKVQNRLTFEIMNQKTSFKILWLCIILRIVIQFMLLTTLKHLEKFGEMLTLPNVDGYDG